MPFRDQAVPAPGFEVSFPARLQTRRTISGVCFDESTNEVEVVVDGAHHDVTAATVAPRGRRTISLSVGLKRIAHRARVETPSDDGLMDSGGSETADLGLDDGDLCESDPLNVESLQLLVSALRLLTPEETSQEQRDLLQNVMVAAANLLGSDTQPLLDRSNIETADMQSVKDVGCRSDDGASEDQPPARRRVRAQTENLTAARAPPSQMARRKSAMAVQPTRLASAGTYFSQFLEANSISAIESSFCHLMECCRQAGSLCEVDSSFPYRFIEALKGLPWKAGKIWEMLEARVMHEDHKGRSLAGHSLVVVGAGPVGLRAALEFALQGAKVTVLEKRAEFNRINRLHLWEWVKQDLTAWGAKIFSPPSRGFGADKDYCHIGISELQYLLLKSCLLLGVSVELGFEFKGTEWRDGPEHGWHVLTEPRHSTSLRVDFLLSCDGRASHCAEVNGAKSIAGGLGKEGQAIGIVANFQNTKTKAERDVRQFSWARQFNHPLFTELKTKTHADLENIVYYKGEDSHYVIMTPTKQSLLETGCLLTLEPAPGTALLDTSNVDMQQLKKFALGVGTHFGLPQEFMPTQSVMAFDFSDTRRQEQAVLFVEDSEADFPLPLCLAGDALLEPFWPTGLGCIRGFFSALDCVSAMQTWTSTHDRSAVLRSSDEAYKHLKSVDGQTKEMVLKPDCEWKLHPSTRYRGYRGT